MKIAQVVCVYPPYGGGIGKVAYDFSFLISEKHKSFVLTPKYQAKQKSAKNLILLKPFLSYGNGAFLPQLFYLLKGFDIVHLHYPFFGTAEIVWLAKLVFRKKFKLIIHYHMDVQSSSLFFKILSVPSKIIFNSLFKKADFITCASLDYIQISDLQKIYKKHPKKFIEIPFAIDTKKFQPKKQKNKTKQILFLASLDKAHYFKGLDVLLEAVKKIKTKNYFLNVVGDGDLRADYEALVKKLGILKQVKFWGKLSEEEKIKMYQRADIFVLPSINKNEAFGLVLLEAMACGVPVIASNLYGVRKVFQDGEQGYLFENKNSIDLAEKIDKILNNDILAQKMGEQGRDLVLKKYSFEKMQKNLLNLYERVKK